MWELKAERFLLCDYSRYHCSHSQFPNIKLFISTKHKVLIMKIFIIRKVKWLKNTRWKPIFLWHFKFASASHHHNMRPSRVHHRHPLTPCEYPSQFLEIHFYPSAVLRPDSQSPSISFPLHLHLPEIRRAAWKSAVIKKCQEERDQQGSSPEPQKPTQLQHNTLKPTEQLRNMSVT